MLAALLVSASASVRINEVQSVNPSLPDQYGQLMDWVELHNPTAEEVSLTGYYLSDSHEQTAQIPVPRSEHRSGRIFGGLVRSGG